MEKESLPPPSRLPSQLARYPEGQWRAAITIKLLSLRFAKLSKPQQQAQPDTGARPPRPPARPPARHPGFLPSLSTADWLPLPPSLSPSPHQARALLHLRICLPIPTVPLFFLFSQKHLSVSLATPLPLLSPHCEYFHGEKIPPTHTHTEGINGIFPSLLPQREGGDGASVITPPPSNRPLGRPPSPHSVYISLRTPKGLLLCSPPPPSFLPPSHTHKRAPLSCTACPKWNVFFIHPRPTGPSPSYLANTLPPGEMPLSPLFCVLDNCVVSRHHPTCV